MNLLEWLASFPVFDQDAAFSSDVEVGFFPDQGPAKIRRFRDRVFVGDACEATGNWAEPRGGAWITYPADGADWAIRDATLLAMSPNGKMAIVGMSKASENTDGIPNSIGVAGFSIADHPGKSGWAFYADLQHEPGANRSYGIEIAAKNKDIDRTDTPYSIGPGVKGIVLTGGGDPAYGGDPANPSNVAILIGKHSHTWNKGIVFAWNGLTGSDGVTGNATAIEMARGHQVRWRGPGNIQGAAIRSDVSTSGKDMSLVFSDDQASFFGTSGTAAFAVAVVPGAVNRLRATSSVAGASPTLEAIGADPDVDLKLSPKGNGKVQFGTRQATSDVPITGYIEIKDASGTVRKLAVVN